jgi:hypothetical protein
MRCRPLVTTLAAPLLPVVSGLESSAEFSFFVCLDFSPRPSQLDYISPAKVSGPIRQEKNENYFC